MDDFINSTVNTKFYNTMQDEHQIISIIDKEAVVENIGTIVSGDTNSCLLTFEINRLQDGIDLSDKKIRFNYKNSNGKFYDIAVNVKYNDEVIRFSWLLPYSLTQPGGNVIASIEFYGATEYDEQYSYKTKNFKLSVEKSLGVSDESDESYNNWTIKIENDVEAIHNRIGEIEKDIKSLHIPSKLSEMEDDSEHRTVSDSQINSWNSSHENVQADWNESNIDSNAYIKNKPLSLPASDVYEWAKQPDKPTYNASEVRALPDNTKIPSKTSDLQNDSGYLTEHQDLSDYALKGDLADKLEKPATPPDAAGKVLRVLSVNEDGTFTCEWADAPAGGGVTDVQISEVSIVQNGVANIPWGSTKQAGVFMIKNNNTSGIARAASSPSLEIDPAVKSDIDSRRHLKPVIPTNLDYAVKAAMCDGKGEAWTADEQAMARTRIGEAKFELIEEIILTEDVSSIERDKDPNGKNYNYKSIAVVLSDIPSDSPPGRIKFSFGTAENYNVFLMYLNAPTSGSRIAFAVCEKNGLLAKIKVGTPTVKAMIGPDNFDSRYSMVKDRDYYGFYLSKSNLNHVSLGVISNYVIPTGTKIRIYGVRA